MNDASPTFWQAAWRRLKKNKGAMAGGIIVIIVTIIIAVFSYLLAPDPSPFWQPHYSGNRWRETGLSKRFSARKKSGSKTGGFFFTDF